MAVTVNEIIDDFHHCYFEIVTTADADTTEVLRMGRPKSNWTLSGTRASGGVFSCSLQGSLDISNPEWHTFLTVDQLNPFASTTGPWRAVRLVQDTGAGANVTTRVLGV